MSRKLYVGNLPFSTSEEELESLFSEVGSVESVTIVKNQDTGRPRGFAFVEMKDEAAAESALKTFNLKPHAGRYLNVNAIRSAE
jgi:RNA recognition motif-containing protein